MDPLPIDDVAADFPGLTIICAHPAWPWTDMAIAMAVHKANIFVDLSGWSPKYFPPQLGQGGQRPAPGQRRCSGTDFPFIKPDRWLRDFEKLELKPRRSRKGHAGEREKGAEIGIVAMKRYVGTYPGASISPASFPARTAPNCWRTWAPAS